MVDKNIGIGDLVMVTEDDLYCKKGETGYVNEVFPDETINFSLVDSVDEIYCSVYSLEKLK